MEESKDCKPQARSNYGGEDRSSDLQANLLQVAYINKILPKGYKFELLDAVKR